VSDVLHIKRTLKGAEIDKIVSDAQALRGWRSSIGAVRIGVSASWRVGFGQNVIMPTPRRSHILHIIWWSDGEV